MTEIKQRWEILFFEEAKHITCKILLHIVSELLLNWGKKKPGF